MKLPLVFLALVVFVGCVGGGVEEPASITGSNASGELTESFAVGLDDIPEDADWVAVDVRSPDGTELNLTLSLDERYAPTSELRRCAYLGATDRSLMVASSGQSQQRVTARPVASEPLASKTVAQKTSLQYSPAPLSLAEGRATILLAYNDASAWRGEGAQAELSVEAEQPLRWQIATAGAMTCIPRLTDYEGGTLVEAGGTTYGEGLQAAFTVEGEGYGYAYPRADGRYAFELDGPNGTVWQESKITSDPALLRGGELLEGLPSGTYEVHVEEIAGASRAGADVMVVDVPLSVADALEGSNGTSPGPS